MTWIVDILKAVAVLLLGVVMSFITFVRGVGHVNNKHILYGSMGILAGIGLMLFALLCALRLIIGWYI